MTVPYNIKSRNNSFWRVIIWTISLICIYEVEIRKIVYGESFTPIGLLPGFWLSDFGLVFPIFISILFGALKSFFRIRLVKYILAACTYGIIMSILHGNSFVGIGGDLRIIIALLTGFSLVYLMPGDCKKTLTFINIISFLIVIIIAVHLNTLKGNYLIDNARIYSTSAFVLIAMPLTLIAPIIILSTFIGKRLNLVISWVTFLILIAVSVIIMKTRSLLFAEVIALLVVIIAVGYSARFLKHIKDYKHIIKYFLILLIFSSVALVPIIISQRGNIEVFMQRVVNLEDDTNISWRQSEVLSVYQMMGFTDLIFGMGFNPPSPLISDEEGDNYNWLHVGILNLWWRFGFIVFMAWMILYIRLVINWINSLRSFKKTISGIKIDQRRIAVIICAPGIFTIVSESLLSGGWSIPAFLPLGVLLGLYNIIIHDKHIGEGYAS